MKKMIKNARRICLLLLTILLTGGYAIANEYTIPHSLHPLILSMYTSPFRYVPFGILIVAMIYVGYRYWHDNKADDDISHTPHHQ